MATKTKLPKASKSKVTLEKIIGNTTRHNSSLAKNLATGEFAYAAGSYVVIVNPAQPLKHQHLVSPKPKPVSCLAFSGNGKYLAVGESGFQPAILIWDLQQRKIILELRSHKFGVGCVAFSPNSKWLVSAGFERDQMLEVWDWREQKSLACSKLASKVYAIDFTIDGGTFITVGDKHFKFWEYVDSQDNIKKTEKMHKGQYILEGRSAGAPEKLKDKVLNACFVDVAVAQNGAVYSITKDGSLLQVVPEERRIDKLVNLKVNFAAGLSLTSSAIAIGCSDGIVRLFHPDTLSYITTMPKPPAYGKELTKNNIFEQSTLVPDVLALILLPTASQVVCFYADNSIFTWNSKDEREFSIVQTSRAHAGCIWDMAVLSSGQVVTASADNTIRFWDFGEENSLARTISIVTDPAELQLTSLEHLNVESLPSYEGTGVRALAISPDESHLASGDRSGNVRVHELEDDSCIATFPAHDAEVLSIHYSFGLLGEPQFLASASRDRLIHLFERTGFDSEAYTLRKTLDDHTSTVAAVKFAYNGEKTRLISCSSDKSIIFRNMNVISPGEVTITPYQRDMMASSAADLEVDPESALTIAVGSDKKVTTWDISSGKRANSVFTAETDAKGSKQLKIDFDPSGQLAITVSQDKLVRLYDTEQGALVAKVGGHADLITAARVTRDCERLVTCGVDGCIFSWKLSSELVEQLKKRLERCSSRIPRELALHKFSSTPRASTSPVPSEQSHSTVIGLKNEIPLTSLPKWAQNLKSGVSWSSEDSEKENAVPRPHFWLGRWATELESVGVQVYSALLGDAYVPQSRRFSLDKAVPLIAKTQAEDPTTFVIDNDESGKTTKDISEGETEFCDEDFSSETPDFMNTDMETFQENFLPKSQKPAQSRLSLSTKFHSLPKSSLIERSAKKRTESPKVIKLARDSPVGTPTRIPFPPSVLSSPLAAEGTASGTPSRLLQPTKINLDAALPETQEPEAQQLEYLDVPEIKSAPRVDEDALVKRNKWELEVERSRQRLRDLGISVPENSRIPLPTRLPSAATLSAVTTADLSSAIQAQPGEVTGQSEVLNAAEELNMTEEVTSPVQEAVNEPEVDTPKELDEGQESQSSPLQHETVIQEVVSSAESTETQLPTTDPDESIDEISNGANVMMNLLAEDPSEDPEAEEGWNSYADELQYAAYEEQVTVSEVMSNLKYLFDMSLHLYSMSQSEDVQNQFEDLFIHMRQGLDDILPSRDQEIQNELLESYSEKLLEMMKKKLQM